MMTRPRSPRYGYPRSWGVNRFVKATQSPGGLITTARRTRHRRRPRFPVTVTVIGAGGLVARSAFDVGYPGGLDELAEFVYIRYRLPKDLQFTFTPQGFSFEDSVILSYLQPEIARPSRFLIRRLRAIYTCKSPVPSE